MLFNFTQKAVLRASAPYLPDEVLEVALAGDIADLYFLPDDSSAHDLIITEPELLSQLQDVLQRGGVETRAEIEYVPISRVGLSLDDFEKNNALIDSLEELDDVDCVFHNIEDL